MVKQQKAVDSVVVADQAQPGQVIAPGGSEVNNPKPQPPAAKTPVPNTNQQPVVSTQAEEQLAPRANEDAGSQAVADGLAVSWTASEFIAHEKSPGWYAGLAAVAAVLIGIILLITRDYFVPCAVVVVCTIMFGVYAARKPRELEYSLDQTGVTVATKHYAYTDFRCFSINHEGAFASIDFMPLKRFMPVLTVYYPPNDEPAIIAALNGRLPYQEPRHDAVERLLKQIRF